MTTPVQATLGDRLNLDGTIDFDASVGKDVNIILEPYSTANIRVSFGDGTIQSYNFNSQITVTHTYSGTQVYKIQMFGINQSIRKIEIDTGDRFKYNMNSQDLPDGAEIYRIRNSNLRGDNLKKFPPANVYDFRDSKIIASFGDIETSLTKLNLGRTGNGSYPKTSGDIANLPMTNPFDSIRVDETSIKGSTKDLPVNGGDYNFNGCSFDTPEANVFTFISNKLTRFRFRFIPNAFYTQTNYSTDISNATLRFANNDFTTTMVDNILIDLSNNGSTDGSLDLNNTAVRSSNSDSAVNNLVNNLNWTLTLD